MIAVTALIFVLHTRLVVVLIVLVVVLGLILIVVLIVVLILVLVILRVASILVLHGNSSFIVIWDYNKSMRRFNPAYTRFFLDNDNRSVSQAPAGS